MSDVPPLLNRELSWLDFNARVLEEARDPSVPLLERLRFLAIFSSNLDEFFMIRYAGIWRQLDAGVGQTGPDGRTPRDVLAAVSTRVHALVREQHRVMLQELLPLLADAGIRLVRPHEVDADQARVLSHVFHETILPVITPIAIDPGHPFPYLSNRSLALVAEIDGDTDHDLPAPELVVIHIPPGSILQRFVRVPSPPGTFAVVLLEDVIRMHLDRIYAGMHVKSCHTIRVTRDSELDIDPDRADDLLATIEAAVRVRRMGAAVRLQYDPGTPEHLLALLVAELELDPTDLYEAEGFTAFADLNQLYGLVDLPALKYAPWTPQPVPRLHGATSIFDAIDRGDVLVHHPYQGFDSVVRFVTDAAHDPDVVALKMTLYRVSGDSRIAQALLAAAQNGKSVAVLVELRARFSEEGNIAWARRLEAAGAHVVYGIVGMKTHAKAALVVRRHKRGLRRYCHLGTGNYNESTANLYTDFGLFTCRESFAEDLSRLFNLLTGYARPAGFTHLVVAPMDLRRGMIDRIRREAAHARAGRPARMIAKLNALVDPKIIRELYAASQAGVEIDLILRGICCLEAGVPGLSETIRVRSIIDRFLEHARVFWFHNDGDEEYWLSSADWMQRNLDGRIEIAFPVVDPRLQRQLDETLELQLADTVKARLLLPDGSPVRPPPGDPPLRSQEKLMAAAKRRAARGGR